MNFQDEDKENIGNLMVNCNSLIAKTYKKTHRSGFL